MKHLLVTGIFGQVIYEATFPRRDWNDRCKNELKTKLLTMKGWVSGQMKGKNVCTHFNWPIRISRADCAAGKTLISLLLS